uniref:Uncharacterized protein n=1 Tax=Panagrolaimus sp. ES5 TaxID=591445 RepID=A0AC34FMP8_9BILA
MSAPYEYQSEDSDMDFQPKRIKIDLNKQPVKSCMKKAAPPPEPSNENDGYDDDDEHLLDSDNDYQGYDDNGFNQAEQDRYIESEHSEDEDNDDDYDSEPFDQKMIQESLAKKPAKSILKKRSVTEDESNNSRASTSESASTYKSLSDSEPETAPLHNADTRFLIKSDKDGILADFTGIYA